MDSEIRMFSDKKFMPAMTAAFTQIKREGHFTDTKLEVEGHLISCHRIILAAASPYFYKMLTSGMAESRTQSIKIYGTSFKTMNMIVEYLYSNAIMLTADNVQSIFIASDLFQMTQLKYGCEQFMSTLVDSLNCIGFLHFAGHFQTEILENAAKQCALDNFSDVIETPDFLDLSEKEMILLFSSNELNIPCEETAIEALIRWVGNDPTRNLHNIIKHIRFAHCDPEFILRLQEVIGRVKTDDLALSAEEHDPRHSYDNRLLVTVGDRHIGCIRAGNTDFTGWKFITDMPKHPDYYSACALPDGILISGGYRPDFSSNACWLFKTDTLTWKPLPRLKTARGFHVSMFLCGSLFVVGGTTDQCYPVDSIEKLDMRKHSPWNEVTFLPDLLTRFCAVSLGQSIFVIGGSVRYPGTAEKVWNERRTSSLITSEYDVIENIWCQRACLPEPCYSGGAVSFQDKIYVFGGKRNFCYSYDPAADLWTSLESPRAPISVSTLVLWRKKVLVCGEQESTTFLDVYDPIEDQWNEQRLSLQGVTPGVDFEYLLHVNFF